MKMMTKTKNYCTPKFNTGETPSNLDDIVCLTLHIEGQRVMPTISPLADRPLTTQETQFAIRVANFAARVLA